MFILALIILILATIGLVTGTALRRRSTSETTGTTGTTGSTGSTGSKVIRMVSFGGFGLGALLLVLGSVYTQDQGEANVLKDLTGNIVGQSNDTGLHFKAPWVDTVTYNIRNQQIIFANANSNPPGQPDGSEITVQDKDGVTSNLDVSVRYSLRASSVTDIYKQFKSESNFKLSFIEQDIKSVVRLAPNQFTTIDLLTNRAAVEVAIKNELETRWEKAGVTVDSISLQDIRPPESVKQGYADAQTAQISVTTEKSNLEAATVKAQLKVATATAEAEANRLLSSSLDANVLESKRLDSLVAIGAGGNLVVVPEGTTPFVQVTKK
jgi:regulator of protease activity HflC (stomatin/prohibitin superfamily)